MIISKKIKAFVVAGALSFALATPLFTPMGSVVPGNPVASVQAKVQTLTIKEARKKLRKKIKEDGHDTNFTYRYQGSEDGYYVFYIYTCSGSHCSPAGYGEVHKKTGKIHYQFGV